MTPTNPETPEKPVEPENPKTGDSTPVLMLTVAASVSGAAAVLLCLKKGNRQITFTTHMPDTECFSVSGFFMDIPWLIRYNGDRNDQKEAAYYVNCRNRCS